MKLLKRIECIFRGSHDYEGKFNEKHTVFYVVCRRCGKYNRNTPKKRK